MVTYHSGEPPLRTETAATETTEPVRRPSMTVFQCRFPCDWQLPASLAVRTNALLLSPGAPRLLRRHEEKESHMT